MVRDAQIWSNFSGFFVVGDRLLPFPQTSIGISPIVVYHCIFGVLIEPAEGVRMVVGMRSQNQRILHTGSSSI